MKQFRFIESRKDAQWSFQLSDGRIIEVMALDGKFVFKFDTPINLETREIGPLPPYTPGALDNVELPDGFTTLNQLTKQKLGKILYCYDEYEINLGYKPNMTIKKAIRIAKEFQKNGFKVTSQAIMHNYDAWKAGWKVGYRDEENGYHLFTPCGGNPFDLRATTLEECCADWQITYLC